MITKIFIVFVSLLASILVLTNHTDAFEAKIFLLAERNNFKAGETFNVDVKIKTDEVLINAAQATIRFPKDLLELTEVDKTSSVFVFWVDGPTVSNDAGTLKFVGGTSKSIAGDTLQVLRLKFKTKGTGRADVTISDAAVTASDGKGTNVLSSVEGVTVLVSSEIIQPAVPTFLPTTSPAVSGLQKVERSPILAEKLSQKPQLEIPFYPDMSKWYGHLGEMTVFWKVPDDVIQVAVAFNQNPNTLPQIAEKVLTTGKKISVLEDGLWYVHTRFRNNIGWGPVAHYSIFVDTKPPLPFKVGVKTGLVSDNPSPVLLFSTRDSLSGLSYYLIQVDSSKEIKLLPKEQRDEFILESLPPGKHLISVTAVDKAGNSIADKIEVEVLPIQTPEVTYVLNEIRLGTDDRFSVRGLSIPNSLVILTIKDKSGFLVFQKWISVDGDGEWTFELEQDLRRGGYFVTIQAKDLRGALSLPTDVIKIKVVERPIISIAGINITLRELVYILLIILVGSGSYFWRRELSHFALAHREAIIIRRDLKNSLDGLRKGIAAISGVLHKDQLTETDKTFYRATLKKLEETIEKSEKYISEDIEKMH